ncbi:WD domain, G-beta repeat protein [Teladorsagia circumcincta]|uniref:WD domain, G-beta repeat protein n=1 Tax=Teladorsagia circumcincta TaxID=45464 RepID=A0A2G9V4J9_TELCI|nr:WD domain, G-beta repeat protein [Teladorsagia circumcincta]
MYINSKHVRGWVNKQRNEWNTFEVHTVNWDSKNESACLVLPNARTLPLLVVGTTNGAQIFDMRTQKLLEQQLIETGINVGTSIGHIMQFHCSGETSITTKKLLKEHTASISDLATCRYDDITCSGDCSGTINVWNKNIKGVQLKIATQHPITAMSVLRKQVIVGTLRGRVLFYSISGGELMAEILAHARSITCISVAPESAYVLTGSEDGRFIVYKLHTRKPQAYQVEYRFSDELPNCAIMGAQFTNGRGSSIAVTCFDRNAIYEYRIVKKATA